MGIRITQVDAFTDKPFAGNPAAVCILSAAAEDQWMQQVVNLGPQFVITKKSIPETGPINGIIRLEIFPAHGLSQRKPSPCMRLEKLPATWRL